MKKVFIILVLLAAFMTSCKSESEPKYIQKSSKDLIDMTPSAGGQINLPLTTVDTMNPLLTHNKYYYYVSKLVFEPLARFDKSGNIQTQLAESYEISADKKSVAVNLKRGVFWHDGGVFSSDDVVFTYKIMSALSTDSPYKKLIWNAAGYGRAVNLSDLIDVTKIDDTRLIIKLSEPLQDAAAVLCVPILSSKSLTEDEAKSADFNKLVGTGPYKVSNINPGKNIDLELNDKYYANVPMISSIKCKMYERENDIVSAFESGQLQLIPYKSSDVDKYQSNKRIVSEEYRTNELLMLVCNMRSPIFQGENGKALRKAIHRAIDKKRILETVFLGHGEIADSLIPNDKLKQMNITVESTYDPDEAIGLLKDARMKQNESENGEKLDETIKLRLCTNYSNKDRELICNIIQENLKKISVQVEQDYGIIGVVDGDKSEDAFNKYASRLRAGEFDIALIGLDMGQVEDLSSILLSAKIGSGNNIAAYSSEDMDRLVEDSKIYNGSSKEAVYGDILSIIADENFYIPILFPKKSVLLDQKIRNPLEPGVFDLYYGLRDCYIPVGLQ